MCVRVFVCVCSSSANSVFNLKALELHSDVFRWIFPLLFFFSRIRCVYFILQCGECSVIIASGSTSIQLSPLLNSSLKKIGFQVCSSCVLNFLPYSVSPLYFIILCSSRIPQNDHLDHQFLFSCTHLLFIYLVLFYLNNQILSLQDN